MEWFTLFDLLRLVTIIIASVFWGIILKSLWVKHRSKETPFWTGNTLLMLTFSTFALSHMLEHLFRFGYEPTWRLFLNFIGYTFGVLALYKICEEKDDEDILPINNIFGFKRK